MPLPLNNTAWPPAELDNILPKLREYSALYSNDTDTLGDIYAGANSGRKGVWGRLRTWFLGTKPAEQQDTSKIHISLGQEICRTSANLLFSEPATATVDAPPVEAAEDEDGNESAAAKAARQEAERAQERLDLIAGPQFEQTIVSAAEISAALGGVYFRTAWDVKTRDHAFITKVDMDMALPVFSWGQLVAVTFWRVVAEQNNTVWRHLERHELVDGNGVIFHGLYQGTTDNLGVMVPLTEQAATAGIQVDADGKIDTLTPGLAVAYAPNISPSALWRHDPLGANLGRSDLEGIEQSLDALDELYSSWLRDIRLGKGRLIVGESMLRDLGAGMGSGFDLDKSIFTPVKAAPSSAGSEKMAIESVQFEIRTEDFLKAIDHFRRIILGAAGYSPQTFGMVDDGGAVTATEVGARERVSFITRKRKILGLKPALEYILAKTLAVDAEVFPGKGAKALDVTVAFPDGLSDDPEAIARTNQLDWASQSASVETRVRRAHPDWDETQISDEVAAIRKEFGGELADPETFGQDGNGLSTPPVPAPEPVSATG